MANGTITMDADEFITRLTRAKVSRPQAEAIVKGIEKDASFDTSDLATKEFVSNEIKFLEERITRKMAQQQITTIAAIAAIMAIFRFWGGGF